MSTLLIIDSHAVLHRAYHALPKETFKNQGQTVNAVYGFFSMLLASVFELKPDFLIACFDSPGPTFRQEKYLAYQANRLKTEEDLKFQIKATRKIVKNSGIPALIASGFEADDIIGTIIKKLQNSKNPKVKKSTIIIVTGDKDLMQLVDDRVSLFLLGRGVSGAGLVGPKEVEDKLGISPDQVVDYKALVGDPSDNYPGVFGVGPKTAVELLAKFSSLNKIYQHLQRNGPVLKKKLEEGKDSALLSKELAQIAKNVPIKLNLKKSKWDRKKLLKVQSLLKEWGFRSLVNRIEKNISPKQAERQMKLV